MARQGQRIKSGKMHFMPEVRAGMPNWSVAVAAGFELGRRHTFHHKL
jgi:hypothetical protein